MAWLNFNDSLNNLKGQISNFANNVLADEDEGGHSGPKYEEIKQQCVQQELEIQRLNQVISELTNKQKSQNGTSTNDTWSWDSTEEQPTNHNQSDISNLKDTICKLENDKVELLTQLEQLDADNQENLFKVVTIRNRLQEELAEMQEKYLQLKNEAAKKTQNEEKLRDDVASLQEKVSALEKLDDHDSLEMIKEKNQSFLVDNQKTRLELEQAQKELSVLKSSSDTLQKVFEDYKYATEKECSENIEAIKKLEAENKIIYSELQKAKDRIKLFEQKSLEDEDNCKKLAFILETYEQEVSALKEKVEDLQAHNELVVRNAQEHHVDRTLEQELDQIQSSHQLQIEMLQNELESLKLQEAQNNIDGEKLQDLNSDNVKLKEEIGLLHSDIQGIQLEKQKLEQLLIEMEKHYLLEKEQFVQELMLLKEERDDLILKNNNVKICEEKDLTDSCTNPQENWTDLSKINEKLTEENRKLKASVEDFEAKTIPMLTNDMHKTEYENKLKELHNKYISIITENIKSFQDSIESSAFHKPIDAIIDDSEDSKVGEFSKQVHSIFKILLELRVKCQELEKKVFDLTEDKTKILTEKNYEIEKLMHNSEVLSQEVLSKTQIIKEYENEINELAKNNELLINELEIYKNNPGLQTISESNEDNMVLLETQLENANKHIEDLERVIDELEKEKGVYYDDEAKDVTLLVAQLENANKRIEDLERIIDDFESQQNVKSDFEINNSMSELNVAEEFLSEKDQQYKHLQNNYEQLQQETEILKNNLDTVKTNLEDHNELKTNFEKLKAEYENMEYQISEFNINAESIRDENDHLKAKIDTLLGNFNKFQNMYEESAKSNESLKTELVTVKENLFVEEDVRKNLELQIKALTEKLQNAKMNETTLKLQYDTLCKELAVAADGKQNLELSINKVNEDLANFQNNFVDLQTQYDKIYFENEELKKGITDKDSLVTELQCKLEQFQTNAVEENSDLLKKLPNSESHPKIVDQLQNSLERFENIVLDDCQQKTDVLSIEDNGKPVMEIHLDKYNELQLQYDVLIEEKRKFEQELLSLPPLQAQLVDALQKCAVVQQQLQEITNSRNELITMVTTKHQESIAYHNEIQRLTQILNMEAEKCRNYEIRLSDLNDMTPKADLVKKEVELEKISEQNSFLKEKCEVMAKNLLEEQAKVQQLLSERSSPSEKEITLQKNLDRLQAHLIELEEHYTQELLHSEQKISDLQSKMNELEDREKSSSNMYTSVSIRANQQVESLQSQLLIVTNERDSLRKQISDAEDNNNKQAAALANLQFVLEQFRRDKEKQVQKETERIRRQINVEKQVQDELKKEIAQLKSQLDESNQGLLAAARLSDQLETSKRTVSALKEEVSQLQKKLVKKEEELKEIASQTDGKVDKSLVKNLVIGFVSTNSNKMTKDQMQILKIIATVLDFSQQDHDKVNLNTQQQASWLSSLLSPQPGNQSMTQESLSQAFIKFLENESKPRIIPNLLNSEAEPAKTISSANASSTSRQSPIVLNEIVLPTFADFGQNRNSSSILKDVLKDSS